MTEADWLTTTDNFKMLAVVARRGVVTQRLQSFSAACARQVWPILGERLRGVVDQLHAGPPGVPHADLPPPWTVYFQEYNFALDGVVEELQKLHSGTPDARALMETHARYHATRATGLALLASDDPPEVLTRHAMRAAGQAIEYAERLRIYFAPGASVPSAADWDRYPVSGAGWTAQADLLRCVFGNPFRPVAFDPSWRTEAVVGLARGMDEAHDFTPLSVLADALEDAGCEDAELLAHCRGPGPHARGCHAIDQVLGRW